MLDRPIGEAKNGHVTSWFINSFPANILARRGFKLTLYLTLCVAAPDNAGELPLEVVAFDGQLVFGQDGHVGEDDQVPGLENSLGVVIVAERWVVFDLQPS